MTVSTLATAMNRIKHAQESSPIVVATIPQSKRFDVFFYETAYGKYFVGMKPPSLVGVFHGAMNMDEVAHTLRKTQGY